MQNPAITFSDNRFMIGFTQNYIPQDVGQQRTTLFNAMTSLSSTSTFLRALGGVLGLLDTARGLFPFPNPAGTGINTSSRYVRYANFPNGNVIAVYYVELPITAPVGPPVLGVPDNGVPLATVLPTASRNYTRTVYATIYNAATHTWTAAVQLGTATISPPLGVPYLGTGNQTDMGVDYVSPGAVGPAQGGNYANFCRPSVATSGDNSAMVAWCEQPQVGVATTQERVSQVMYARYVAGVWQPLGGAGILAAPLIGKPALAANIQANPWFNGKVNALGIVIPVISVTDRFAPGIVPLANPRFVLSGVFPFTIVYASPVTAIDAFASPSQFNIQTDANGGTLVCPTLQLMINTALSQVATQYWDFGAAFGLYLPSELGASPAVVPALPAAATLANTKTLSQLGLSMRLDPACDEANSATWNISSYYNRSLVNTFHAVDFTSNPNANQQNVVTGLYYGAKGARMFLTTGTTTVLPTAPPALGVPLAAPNQESWARSAMVDVAGDGAGNFALVRSIVQPFFQDNDFTRTGVSRARGLVGHQFSGNLNAWIQRPGANALVANTGGEPAMSFISSGVSCANDVASGAGSYSPCSVRNPKFLMSDSGKGLVLFHQNQALNTNSPVGNPNRLWWATYSTGSGFGSVAAPLDLDTTCLGSSVTSNDASVCEAQSYDIQVTGGFQSRCQTVGEPSGLVSVPLFPISATAPFTGLTHDPPGIAAHMNRAGTALVAYTKSNQTGALTAPSCGNIGVYVAPYDTFNGFGTTLQMDADGVGDSMHPAVYVSPAGNMAVVWEQVVGTVAPLTKYVWLRTYHNGVWSAAIKANVGQTDSAEAMMPGVGINDSGEIVVSYTYGPGNPGPTRRQYVYHYHYH